MQLPKYQLWREIGALLLACLVGLGVWYVARPKLSPESTVYEYQIASPNDKVRYRFEEMSGLPEIDIRCGFWANESDVVRCFEKAIVHSKPWARLRQVGMVCGRLNARLSGTYGDPQRCKQLGGTWGKFWGGSTDFLDRPIDAAGTPINSENAESIEVTVPSMVGTVNYPAGTSKAVIAEELHRISACLP